MKREQQSEVYPRVEKVLSDGTIISYDKFNKLNTDLNINTLTEQQQYDVFGCILIKTTLQSNTHDYEYLHQKDEEIQKSNRKNKILLVGLTLAFLVIGLLVFKSCSNDTDKTINQDDQVMQNSKQEDVLQQSDAELQQQIKDTQESIKSNDAQSQNKIDALKQQVQDLKDSLDSKQANQVANQYDNTVDNLQNAENERQNGNIEKMQNELDKVSTKLDDITQKITDWLNSQSE